MLIGTDAEAAALRREAMKARMDVIKMRIDLKKVIQFFQRMKSISSCLSRNL